MKQTRLAGWNALTDHRNALHGQTMSEWFAADDSRAQRFTASGAGITLDFSKNRITDETLRLLLALADEAGVAARRDAMFAGEQVNVTEGRAALHTALRAPASAAIGGADIAREVAEERAKMAAFAEKVRGGQWQGFSGQPIRHIVNIGIGGSDLGPKMVCHALSHLGPKGLSMHFVSNVDGTDMSRVLAQLDPASTLAIIVSKTFTTQETMTNALTLRDWMLANGCPQAELHRHFVGVSANTEEVVRFGIAASNVFKMWDWVGGRYSLWSAVGLSIMLQVGAGHFGALLDGAHAMDMHFRDAPLERNLPVLLGMLGIWYRDIQEAQSQLIAPYSEALHYLPAYLQQLEMESNGKSARLDGTPVTEPTAPIIWGEPGTNGQHAFFQMLHQGPTLVPIDFIAALRPEHTLLDHHVKLLANCFAQSEALMLGRSVEEAARIAGPDRPDLVQALVFPGNRPSNTLLIEALTPATLGALIALYEHKVLVQAAVWQINPFDQYGVELGKVLGKVVEADLRGAGPNQHDASTRALIARARQALGL